MNAHGGQTSLRRSQGGQGEGTEVVWTVASPEGGDPQEGPDRQAKQNRSEAKPRAPGL